MLVNSVTAEEAKDERPLTSNEMEKVLELQNSVMLRRRLNFGYPDYGYRGLYGDDGTSAAETVYEQQKLLQNFLKHYQMMDESSTQWMNLCNKEEQPRKDDGRKRYKRDEEGKVFAKQRKTNFTAKEVETLLQCVADKKEVILFGVAGGKGWARAWQDIAKIVSRAEGIERTEGDVRKKWTYLKWEAKNTSKPGRDPVSKHVLNILTSRDREVAEAMTLRTSLESFPKDVQPGTQLQSPASSPVPVIQKSTSPPQPVTKKPMPAAQPIPKASTVVKEPKLPAKIAPKVLVQQQQQQQPPPPPQPQPPAEVCLRWNSYHSNMQNTFPSLLNNEQFVDVTLACDGRSIKCHKVMLSACSPYMEELLSANPCQHPIIFLKDMKFWQLAALVDFMYRGEVNVTQDKLPSLLSAAEALQIKGLASPVHPTSPQRHHSDPETDSNVSLLRQFKSEIKTEPDDDYLQDTDDSLSSNTVSRPKKRKISEGNNSTHQVNGKKAREKMNMSHKENQPRSTTSPSLPAAIPISHHQPPDPSHTESASLSRPEEILVHYSDYPQHDNSHNNSGMSEDINIDEEQAQMILERYSQQDDNYSRDGDDYSNGSG